MDNYEETEAMLSLATKLTRITCKVHPNVLDSAAQLADKQVD